MKKIVSLIISIIVLVSIPGCGILKDDIKIIYTSDIHCDMDGALDYASVKAYKDYLKKNASYVTLIDGGDFIEGGLIGENGKGKNVVKIMNNVGYDIVSLGNHEFDYGIDRLQDAIALAKFNIVDCNIKYLGEEENPLSIVKPYVIKRYGPIKVAYVGILTPEVLLEREPSYKKLVKDGECDFDFYADANDTGENGDALFSIIQTTIDEARSKADYVVAISHIGVNHTNVINSYELIEYTYGIDVVLDAHAHKQVDEVVKNIQGDDVRLFAVGSNLDRIGLLTIKKDGTIETSYVEVFDKDNKITSMIEEAKIETDDE